MDGLTGAHQRAPGLAELEREILEARRTNQLFVLAFLDVDGLKAINDTHGHAAGDQVLVKLVAMVREFVREYDLVTRYGGDEFVCGMLNLTLDDAEKRFADMKAAASASGMAFSVGLERKSTLRLEAPPPVWSFDEPSFPCRTGTSAQPNDRSQSMVWISPASSGTFGSQPRTLRASSMSGWRIVGSSSGRSM